VLQGLKCDETMTRLAVLFYRLGPYHLARLRETARLFDLTAVEYSRTDSIYAWDVVDGAAGFKRVTLFETDDFARHSQPELLAAVGGALAQATPEVVAIPGWGDRCSLAALHWCNMNRVPVVMMSDSPEWIVKRRWWKERIKRQLLRLVSAGLAAGQEHRDYLAGLGVSKEQIFLGFDVVDNQHFSEGAERTRLEEQQSASGEPRTKIRERLGLPAAFFLASSRFVEKKNLERLFGAYARYRQLAEKSENEKRKAEIWDLVLLGDGPLRPPLEALRSSLGLEACIHLPGFRQYDELPAFYGLSKAFIMPSISETWGLTVNEAMASGLPVLVSNRCGCASELVVEGQNGFAFRPDDAAQLAHLMLKVSGFNFPLSAFGDASRHIIADWGPGRFAASLRSAADAALSKGPGRNDPLARGLIRFLLSLRIGPA
jgi:glycosyltransferase involved in cell wall biosynthesis